MLMGQVIHCQWLLREPRSRDLPSCGTVLVAVSGGRKKKVLLLWWAVCIALISCVVLRNLRGGVLPALENVPVLCVPGVFRGADQLGVTRAYASVSQVHAIVSSPVNHGDASRGRDLKLQRGSSHEGWKLCIRHFCWSISDQIS